MTTEVWFLPCNETPFLNRNHPIFLAIRDKIVDCDEGRIRLKNFGWVRPQSCYKHRAEAEEELFHHYEDNWLDLGQVKVKSRSTLRDYYRHSGKDEVSLPWFDLHSILYEDYDATS